VGISLSHPEPPSAQRRKVTGADFPGGILNGHATWSASMQISRPI